MSARQVWTKMSLGLGLALLTLGWAEKSLAASPIDLPPSNEPRVPAAQVLEAAGLVASEGVGDSFKRVLAKETVYSRDLIMVFPGLQAVLAPRPKSVTLTLWGNLPGLSDSPVLESAVILHDSRAYDLDFTLVRGRVVLTNQKEKGPAKIWLRAKVGLEIILPEPGDSVALEMYGRWRTGIPFSLKHKEEGPTIFWEINVLKGNMEIKTNKLSYSMSAPPGPAYFSGDNLTGPDPAGPQRRTKLPSWADPKATPPAEATLVRSLVERYRNALKAKDAEEAGHELMQLAEKDPDKARAQEVRRIYVHALAAVDAIDVVADILEYNKNKDARQSAVIALRHWIGSAPGRDAKLYQALLDLRYTKAEAETILQLLHSPFDPSQPETYEALITYLNHKRTSVRALAAWHLYRLAPAGKSIAFQADGSPEDRAKAIEEWKKLIPSGELPPPPKIEKEPEKKVPEKKD